MTIKFADEELEIPRAAADVAAERFCLKCRSRFWSEGFVERICSRCKGSAVWRAAISEGSGHGRRRSGGRLS
ncbi:hypothetical protein SAMN05444398_12714 [Roseovarius pacificus]|uniref:Uncharacterized protein n=2 Tax=Roseovarius TaxID=74030 RepID=A0A5P3ALI4_9RHOB|nr:hypothetical protein RIdsm_05965 [Roseovarius indicus]SFE83069.1 hypothetical protein SAMN04488031_12534 [Roseovarius indicus]SHM63771.1 hypothetical protein SAMN05444398_12714 [Roseovarius pacificus]